GDVANDQPVRFFLPLGLGNQHRPELRVAHLLFRVDDQIGHSSHRLAVALASPMAVGMKKAFHRMTGKEVAAKDSVLNERGTLRRTSFLIVPIEAVEALPSDG